MGVAIGTADRMGGRANVVLADVDRRHHVYAIGQTGTGKSTFLRNALVQDIEEGRGVALLDPHGDLADVIYFNPADTERPIGLNPIQKAPADQHDLIVLSLVSTLRGLWAESWGTGRMQYILEHTIAALLHYDHATLLAVNRMLANAAFRKKVLARCPDQIVRAFWEEEFAGWDKRLRSEAVAPIQNKVGQFGNLSRIRNIVGQARNAVDFRQVMDRGQIFIANLSKGRVGEETSQLLGSFLVAQMQLAALSRSDVPEASRRDFYLYLDEFQNFTNRRALESILSEARKYRLSLTLAHQYTAQVGELQEAIFGNVGTLIAFRVGHEDAGRLAVEFHPLAANSMSDLDAHRAWVRRHDRGQVQDPEFVHLYPPVAVDYGKRDTIIERSRQWYGRPREAVEANISRWLAH